MTGGRGDGPRCGVDGRLSETLPEFLARDGHKDEYDVVIVGSGYGASMAAHALATAPSPPQRVLLLERGREFKPGDFPAGFGDLPRETRVARQETGEVNGHEGLFDIRLGPDVVVMVGNGLGGGSLINAGVMLEPEPDDIASARGTMPHRDTLVEHLRRLKQGDVFTRARRLLGGQVRTGPVDAPIWVHNDLTRLPPAPGVPPRPGGISYGLRKAQALQGLGERHGTDSKPMEVTVAWENGPNLAGTALHACNQCGDCMTGCNVGAKNSLDRSLLAGARKRLADRLTIVTGATVGSLARREGARPGWRLRLFHTDARLQERETGQSVRAPAIGTMYVQARHVVLAAGTLGSPEILLRSRSDQLPLAGCLGESFSGNGDDIAAIHRLPADVHGSADERVPLHRRGIGPTTTARVTLKSSHGAHRPFQVEEFAVPGPVKRVFDELVTTGAAIAALPRGDCAPHASDDEDPLAVSATAMQRTLLVGVVGHDSSDGCLRLAQPLRPRDQAPQLGALRIHWPQARRGAEFDAAHETLRRFAEGPAEGHAAGQPVLVSNPMWRLLPEGLETLVSQPRGPVLTVHPLGGCRIGRSVAEGVVDSLGRVFDASNADPHATFDSLVVLDGSIIGSSLGVNPALTISAIALHAMDQHVQAWGFGASARDPQTEPHRPARPGSAAPVAPSPCEPAPDDEPPLPSDTHVSITERLWGRVQLHDRWHVMELTLAFAPQPASTLVGPRREPMRVLPQDSRLRLYAADEWEQHQLKALGDEERRRFVEYEAALGGTMRFLQRQPSRPLQRAMRGLRAYFGNRGWRDAWQRWRDPLRHDEQRSSIGWSDFLGFARLATRNGQRRLFEYDLHLAEVLGPGAQFHRWPRAGETLAGVKELGYARRASPWTQLTEMRLLRMPGLETAWNPVLKLDARYLARQGKPLLHIERQRNHAEALAELLSLGMYLLRVLLDTHLWSFRKPDRRDPREPYRLPEGIVGLPAPEITTLVVDRRRSEEGAADEPVTIRLTHYRPPAGRRARVGQEAPPPLVMLHGYSASGTTFTHASLGADAAAAWFCRAGRDVWVVDLRTSCGLPSARLPWAMEQPALVDIPAALLHVRNASGRRVDVLAHCIGGVMLGMALLSDGKRVRRDLQELGTETWLTSEQLGTLDAFNGSGPAGLEHPTVNRIVLSQKGPVLRYTDANVLRAYVLQFARRWLLPEHFSFQPSRDPGVAEQLLDRFLASLPYPPADFDVENPRRPCARTEWVATRHRLDALFGRVFSASNLRPATLEAIDDLFGPINLDTVAQTIHFVRFDTITNQRGRGEFVTRRRVRERWGGIPTMVVHGEDNGMVDPYTHRLITDQLRQSGVPVHEYRPVGGVGHQDTLIGLGAGAVFDAMHRFLDGPQPGRLEGGTSTQYLCAEPHVGPRLDPARPHGLAVAAMPRPDQGECVLWLVPVRRVTRHEGPAFELLEGPGFAWRHSGPAAASGQWHRAVPDLGRPADPGPEPGWLALFVYDAAETSARPGRVPPVPMVASALVSRAPLGTSRPPPLQGGPTAEPGPSSPLPWAPGGGGLVLPRDGMPLAGRIQAPAFETLRQSDEAPAGPPAGPEPWPEPPPGVVQAVREWLQRETADAQVRCFVRYHAVVRASALHDASEPEPGFRFALASCQYPYGLFDRFPASASLESLASEAVGMSLMVGDQIYADATAGLVDPTRSDELYDQPHERALRQPGMRAVLRQMPVFMLPDDHELFDNWQPLPDALPHAARRVRRRREQVERARRNGVTSYMLYQRMAAPQAVPPDRIDQQFFAGGHPFYLLDTRTGRERGVPSAGAAGGTIVSAERMQCLKDWLAEHADRVKFVVTPSMLLPRLHEVVGRPANACRADAWDGFPESLAELLRFIGDPRKPIRKTVFLSGDAHHSLYAEARVGPADVKVVSVHSSALYAPYPFANGRPADLCDAERGNDLGVALSVDTVHSRPGDGYAVLEVRGDANRPVLDVQFRKGSCGHHDRFAVSLV